MFKNLIPISKEKHQGKKIKKVEGFDFAKGFNLASVMVHEFSRSATTYPIVFLEDKENNAFRPVTLLGLQQGENLFVEDGKWNASYIPAIIRRYPFSLARTGDGDKFAICIDEGSKLLNEKEGSDLFDDKGEPAPVLKNVRQYLGELQQMESFTHDFCSYFTQKNMFTPLNMRVKQAEGIKSIAGCYVINEERLNNLNNDAFVELREKKYLPAVYAHLISLGQIERLLKFKEKKSSELK